MIRSGKVHPARPRPVVGLIAILGGLLAGGCMTTPTDPVAETAFPVGDTVVRVRVTGAPDSTPTLLNLHDDENTSVQAALAVRRSHGGRIIELRHTGRRHIEFKLADEGYRFDPNRMFSDAGIAASLRRGGNYSEAAHAEVRGFARRLVDTFGLDRAPVIIALHNTDGRGLSIQSYLPEGDHPTAARAVHVSPRCYPGDFFYVTDQRCFDHLQARDFNVTLQDDAHVPNDGSASVYFARRGIPYLNVEADLTHLTEQTEMLRVAHQLAMQLTNQP
jgi:hypothetical protein